MNSLFQYQSFQVNLEKSTRTLFLTFKESTQYFDYEVLFELESILAWCSSKVEINSIYISSEAHFFSQGHNINSLKRMNKEKLEKFSQKLRTINYSLIHLPQTVILDLGEGCKNIATEFSLACDIKIAKENCKIIFDHNNLGIIPCSGGMAQLGHMVGHSRARNWILSGMSIEQRELINSGFIYRTYTNEQERSVIKLELLESIFNQAPVQRIQTKLGLLAPLKDQLDLLRKKEQELAQVAMINEDWLEDSKEDFMPAKNFQEAVKLSLIKDEIKN